MTIKHFTGALDRSQWVINAQTKGLSNDDTLLQPPFRGNCLNWNLGHILVFRVRTLGMLDDSWVQNEEEYAVYGAGSQPLTDPANAIPLETMLERLETTSEAFKAVLNEMSEEKLAEVVNEERGTTTADRIEFHLFHEALHLGEICVLRQLAGTDDHVI